MWGVAVLVGFGALVGLGRGASLGRGPPSAAGWGARLSVRLTSPLMRPESLVLYANFSRHPTRPPPQLIDGYVVEMEASRACERSEAGLDLTLAGAVAAVGMAGVRPWLTGCVSPANQRRFAKDSGAAALLLFSDAPLALPADPSDPASSLPTLLLSGPDSRLLQRTLARARRFGQSLHLTVHRLPAPPSGLADQTLLAEEAEAAAAAAAGPVDVGILVSLALVLLLLLLVTLLKLRWRPRKAQLSLEGMAKSALGTMETRHFCPEAPKRRKLFPKLGLASATPRRWSKRRSVAESSVVTLDACAVCLEEYEEEEELRVLPCGHEFHRLCVDPWILAQRTCPLCQYDAVLQRYAPVPSPAQPRTTLPVHAVADPASPQPPDPAAPRLSLAAEGGVPVVSAQEAGFFILPAGSGQLERLRHYRLPSSSQRRAKRKRRASVRLLPAPDPGYLSDISSLATVAADASRPLRPHPPAPCRPL